MDLELSLKERLTLANQYEILAKLSDDKNDADYYLKLVKILKNGYSKNYYEVIKEFEKEEISEKECDFVRAVLDLYRDFRYSWDQSEDVKKNVEEYKTLFQGFDLNENSKLYSYYEFLIEDGLWDEIKELMDKGKIEGFNSHGRYPDTDKLKEMVEKWEEIKRTRGNNIKMLSSKEINYICE